MVTLRYTLWPILIMIILCLLIFGEIRFFLNPCCPHFFFTNSWFLFFFELQSFHFSNKILEWSNLEAPQKRALRKGLKGNVSFLLLTHLTLFASPPYFTLRFAYLFLFSYKGEIQSKKASMKIIRWSLQTHFCNPILFLLFTSKCYHTLYFDCV